MRDNRDAGTRCALGGVGSPRTHKCRLCAKRHTLSASLPSSGASDHPKKFTHPCFFFPSNQGNTSDRDYLERFQTSPVTARNLPDASLATPSQTRRDRSATQTQTTNRFAPLGEKEDDEAEADPYDPDDETYMIFLQQPSAGVTVRTMQPIFPPAPELRPPTVVDDPASVVKALDRVSWDELITPANLITMREIPTELQEDVLGAMRDILRNMNDC